MVWALTGCNSPETIAEPPIALWIDGEPVLVGELQERVSVSLRDWSLEGEINDSDIERIVENCIRDIVSEKVIRREAVRLGLKTFDDSGDIPAELNTKPAEGFEFLEKSEEEWWQRVVSSFQVMDFAGGISEHLATNLEITEEMIQQEYIQRQDYFTKPESLELQVIRVYDPELANDIHARLDKKWKFETLAQNHSNLKGEGAQGASFVKQAGELPSEYGNELLQLKPGQNSRVLASSEGYFIYRLLKKYPAEVLPLDSVRDRLRKDLVISQRSRIFREWLDHEIEKLDIRRGTPLAISGDQT